MYETREEASQKLADTVVLFKDTPHYIRETVGDTNDYRLVHRYLKKGSSFEETSPKSSDWNFRNLGSRLGYFNFVSSDQDYQQAGYITRVSVRKCQSTQGISGYNTHITPLKKSPRLGLEHLILSFKDIRDNSSFIQMMEGKYPTLASVVGEFQKNPSLVSKAFDRQFAVFRHDIGPYYLQYRTKDIGYTDDFETWRIADDYKYLLESLESYNLKVV